MTVTAGSVASRVYTVLRLALLWGVLAWLAHRVYVGRDAFAGLDLDWRPPEILLALALAVAAYQALFLGWIILLKQVALYRPGALRAYAGIWWYSYFYRYVPGKVLLLVERARRGTDVGIPHAVGAALPVIETLVAILAGSIVSLLAATYYADASLPIVGSLAILAIVVVLIVPAAFRALIRSRPLRERHPELETVDLTSGNVLVLLLPYLLHYLLAGASFFLLSRTVIPLTWPDLPGFSGMYALAHVFSIVVVFAPGGIGVREGALAVQLEHLTMAGIAGALALAARVWFSAVELLCLAGVALWRPMSEKRLPAGIDD